MMTILEAARTRLGHLALLALLAVPSAAFVWHNRDVPHFGVLHDDALYYVGAKAVAQGSGYRILSLPAQPFQTKYPPLYPLYLTLAWLANPAYPQNLSWAILLSWLWLPVSAGLFVVWGRSQNLPRAAIWSAAALFMLNPYTAFFVSNLGSELMFLALLLGALLLAERWPLMAGAVAGLAYLSRTAGLAILPAALLYYLWTKRPRAALWFALGMVPAIAGWMWWVHQHAAPGQDIVTLYYTNYTGFYKIGVGMDNIRPLLWNNLSALLEAMGSLLFPQMLGGILAKLILQPLAVAMLIGCVRMMRMGYGRLYGLFAAFSMAMLLAWNFRPNQRFILPLAPLLLAGFYFEARNFIGLLKPAFAHRDRSQRVVAYGFSGFLGLVLLTGAVLQVSMWVHIVPELLNEDRERTQAYAGIYRWIEGHLEPDATILWENDPVLYLATGRRGTTFLNTSRVWYSDDIAAAEAARLPAMDSYAREQHLEYLLLPKTGPHRSDDALKFVASNAAFQLVHEDAAGILYRVRPAEAPYSAAAR